MTKFRNIKRRIGTSYLVPILVFAVVIGGMALAFSNLFENLRARNISSGFGYLWQTAGFEIGETWLHFTAQMSFGRAALVGIVNTLVAGGAIAIFITLIAIITGFILSFGGATGRDILKRYVGLTRNVPALLHLVVWYAVFREALPAPRNALTVGSTVLSNRGLIMPVPDGFGGFFEISAALGAAAFTAVVLRVATRHWSKIWAATAIMVGFGVWLYVVPKSVPVLAGFNYRGGFLVSPEFCALVLAFGIYAGGYVTEIVRGAIETFPRGQVEAAFALGLSRTQFFLFVMTPQVVRSIAPSMVNMYLNVIKGTSLGVIVGYPDLVTVSNTTINQTGQAVEAIAIILGSYLVISLVVSFASQRIFGSPLERDKR